MQSSNTSVGYLFFCIFFILNGHTSALPLSLVYRPHHYHGASRPYVNLPQRDRGLAHTSGGVDARVSVSSLSRLVNIR